MFNILEYGTKIVFVLKIPRSLKMFDMLISIKILENVFKTHMMCAKCENVKDEYKC